jgi:hypothetical protein
MILAHSKQASKGHVYPLRVRSAAIKPKAQCFQIMMRNQKRHLYVVTCLKVSTVEIFPQCQNCLLSKYSHARQMSNMHKWEKDLTERPAFGSIGPIHLSSSFVHTIYIKTFHHVCLSWPPPCVQVSDAPNSQPDVQAVVVHVGSFPLRQSAKPIPDPFILLGLPDQGLSEDVIRYTI